MDQNYERRRSYLHSLFSCAGIATAGEDADAICSAFSDMRHIFESDEFTIVEKCGCTREAVDFLRLVAALNSRRITDKIKPGKKYTDDQIKEYAKGIYFGCTRENIVCVLFGGDGKLISTEYISDGTVSAAAFLPRKLIDIASRCGACEIVLMHNHPLGTAEPSRLDLETTSHAQSVFSAAGIRLRAHYVVAGEDIRDCLQV